MIVTYDYLKPLNNKKKKNKTNNRHRVNIPIVSRFINPQRFLKKPSVENGILNRASSLKVHLETTTFVIFRSD